MLKKLLIASSIVIVLLALSVNSNPKKIRIIKPIKSFVRVMVIDSGLPKNPMYLSKRFCKDIPNLDLTETTILDETNHGTIVSNLIYSHTYTDKYCFSMIKYYDPQSTPTLNGQRFLQALYLVEKYKPDIVSLSSGGSTENQEEFNIIHNNDKILFYSAAGNNACNLDDKETCEYYPAQYDLPNNIVVGSLDEMLKQSEFSNYGSIVRTWEIGEYPEGKGTSFAVPIAISKKIKELTDIKVIEE